MEMEMEDGNYGVEIECPLSSQFLKWRDQSWRVREQENV